MRGKVTTPESNRRLRFASWRKDDHETRREKVWRATGHDSGQLRAKCRGPRRWPQNSAPVIPRPSCDCPLPFTIDVRVGTKRRSAACGAGASSGGMPSRPLVARNVTIKPTRAPPVIPRYAARSGVAAPQPIGASPAPRPRSRPRSSPARARARSRSWRRRWFRERDHRRGRGGPQ